MTAVLESNQATDTSVVSVAELLGRGLRSGAVVVLPDSEGGGTGWLIAEDEAGDRRCCAVVGVMTSAIIACGPVSEVKVLDRTTAPMDDMAVPEWASALAGLAWKAWRAEAACDAARVALSKHQDRLEDIVDAAHDFANEKSLCTDFDDFMEEQGLRSRTHEYDCEVDVKVRLVVKVTARTAESAEDDVDSEMVKDALRAMSSYDLVNSMEDFDVNDVCEA